MLTVACVLVRGPVKYTPEYVERLLRSCERFISRDFHFVCLTDRPWDLREDIDTIPIPAKPDVGYWAKVNLFDPSIGLRGRVLCIDLDNVPIASLDDVIDFPERFALAGDMHAPSLDRVTYIRHADGRQMVKRYNSGVMVFEGGEYSDIFTDCTVQTTREFWTDQDWIAHLYPNLGVMPVAWFPRISLQQPPWPAESRVLFSKKPKPHEAVKLYPWFDECWGGAA